MKERNIILSLILIFSLLCYLGLSCIRTEIKDCYKEPISDDIIYVIDAGHGGEDGGAVGKDGTAEKDLNLQIAKKLSSIFDIFGISYVMIRNSDISVGDTSLETIRKRKASDINKRYEMINSYSNSVLISIHQNQFPDSKYYGCQVFYSANDSDSEILAEIIQNNIIKSLQPDNNRKIKTTDDSIFLLYKAQRPSVMIECGFMSNEAELIKLKEDSYQKQLSYFIAASVFDYNFLQKDVINGAEN